MEPTEQIAKVDEGQRLRGWIANAYAQIEFILGDIIVRSLAMPEYTGIGETLPHGAPDRIKRIRRILQRNGFFSEFADELIALLDEFADRHETRNLLAHGFCEFHYTPAGDCGLQFRKWHRQSDRQDAQLIRTFRIADLVSERETIVPLSQRALLLLFQMHDRLGLVGN